MINELQKKILNVLLDKYENSKTFTGENKTHQNFSVDIRKMFPDYLDSSLYDFHKNVDESMESLEYKKLIRITRKKNGLIDKVLLNQDSIEKTYEILNRFLRKDIQAELISILNSVNTEYGSPLFKYIEAQKERIGNNKEVEYFKGDFNEFRDLLDAINFIQKNENEILIRTLSVSLFKDSKKLESIQNEVVSILFKYGDYESKETLFAECGVMNTPTTVKMKGNAIINIAGQELDLSLIDGDIELSAKTLKEVKSVKVLGAKVISIENLTSFYEYDIKSDFQIYLGGFHNTTKRNFLKMIYAENKNVNYFHYGDIDAGGFYIYLHLCERTHIPFKLYKMDVDTLIQYKDKTLRLTKNDRNRLQNLLNRGNLAFFETIRYMLDNDCKLEQEAEELHL
jgi:hypothetical protein